MAVAACKHQSVSYVMQDGVQPIPKDRGAEQGDVDGPVECALTRGLVACETRSKVHYQQQAGALPWSCVSQEDAVAARSDYDARATAAEAFRNSEADLRRGQDPRHKVQKFGGLAGFWYLDDGDILCCPILVLPFLQAFDEANPSAGAERSCPKTEVIYYSTQDELDTNSSQWQLQAVRTLATVSTVDDGSFTLGIATGSGAFVRHSSIRRRWLYALCMSVSNCVPTRRRSLFLVAKAQG